MHKVLVAVGMILACFFCGTEASASGPEVSSNGNWIYEHVIDPLTEVDTSYVGNITEGGSEKFFSAACSAEQGPIITFSFGAYVGNTRGRSQEVQYRFMGEVNGEPQQDTWIHVRGKYVVAMGPVVPQMLRNMRRYDTLIIRTRDYRDRPHTMEFDLSGEEGLLNRLPCMDFLSEPTPLDAAESATSKALKDARNSTSES